MEDRVRLPVRRPVAALRAGGRPSPSLSRSSSLHGEVPVCRYRWEPETLGNPLVAPCGCRGTTSQVHHSCLARWLSSSFHLTPAGTVGLLRPASCEVCSRPFFGSSQARRELLLQAALREWQLGQLHLAAGQLAEEEAGAGAEGGQEAAQAAVAQDEAADGALDQQLQVPGAQARAGAGAEGQPAPVAAAAMPRLVRWGQAALALAAKAARSLFLPGGYWRLMLWPIRAAMLSHEYLHGVSSPVGKDDVSTTEFCDWWIDQIMGGAVGLGWGKLLRHLDWRAEQPGGQLAVLGLLCLSWITVAGEGESIGCWLAKGTTTGGFTAFVLGSPITAPVFELWASVLALIGVLWPGQYCPADGLRTVALLPLSVVKWVWSAEGRRGIWRLLGNASAWLRRVLFEGNRVAMPIS